MLRSFNFLIGASLLLASISAQAADHVQCNFDYTPVSGTAISDQKDFVITREPVAPKTGQEFSLTNGSAQATQSQTVGADKITIEYDLGYQHALKTDASGAVISARQSTCLEINARVCNGEGHDERCNYQIKSCAFSSDPFDAHYGWAIVPVENGVAGFDVNAFRVLSLTVNSRAGAKLGDVKAECRYLRD